MLAFFRRIRKGLIHASQARKYLFYALGEIALVVIGILIALQVNNLNEWRKDREKETEVVRALYKELLSNYAYNQARIDDYDWMASLGRSLLQLTGPKANLQSALSRSDHLLFFQYGKIYAPLTTKFEQITHGEDLNLIRDDSLKLLLIEYSSLLKRTITLYEIEAEVGARMEAYIDEFGNTLSQLKYLSDRIGWLKEYQDLNPSKFDENVEKLYSDVKFENLIARELKVAGFVKARLKTVQDHIRRMKNHIEESYAIQPPETKSD